MGGEYSIKYVKGDGSPGVSIDQLTEKQKNDYPYLTVPENDFYGPIHMAIYPNPDYISPDLRDILRRQELDAS